MEPIKVELIWEDEEGYEQSEELEVGHEKTFEGTLTWKRTLKEIRVFGENTVVISFGDWNLFQILKKLIAGEEHKRINGACPKCGVDTKFAEIPRGWVGDIPKGPDFLLCTKCLTTYDGYQCEKCGLVMNTGDEVQFPDGTTLCRICGIGRVQSFKVS